MYIQPDEEIIAVLQGRIEGKIIQYTFPPSFGHGALPPCEWTDRLPDSQELDFKRVIYRVKPEVEWVDITEIQALQVILYSSSFVQCRVRNLSSLSYTKELLVGARVKAINCSYFLVESDIRAYQMCQITKDLYLEVFGLAKKGISKKEII